MIDNSGLYKSPEGYAATMANYDAALRRWPLPYESRYVPTRHAATHVLIAGNGTKNENEDEDAPALFLFHGWAGSTAGASQEYDKRMAEWERIRSFLNSLQCGGSNIGLPGKRISI